MKIRKEYLLLALLLASSAGYLVFQKTDRVHYTMPVLGELKPDELTAIEITRASGKTTLVKRGKDWYLSPQGWRADQTKASEMCEALAKLAVTDLVSESKAFDRYQLDEKGKAVLKAYAGKALRRDLAMGKAAPTYNHTYIRLPGDDRVYLAGGDLPRLFPANVSEMRDMLVFSLTPTEVTRIVIERQGAKTTLTRHELPPEQAPKGDAKDKPKLYLWKNEKGVVVDKADMDTMLSGLSKVYCGEYLDDAVKASLSMPDLTLRFTGEKEHILSLYGKTGEKIPATTSQSESPFVFPDYKHEALTKSLNAIIKK